MGKIKFNLLAGNTFVIDGNREYVFKVVKEGEDLALFINDKRMEAVVYVSYKTFTISVVYAGLILDTTVRLRDIEFTFLK